MFKSLSRQLTCLTIFATSACTNTVITQDEWLESQSIQVSSTEQWESFAKSNIGLEIANNQVSGNGQFTSERISFDHSMIISNITFEQNPEWSNWQPTTRKIAPKNLSDAPVFLPIGKGDYWIFGRYHANPQSDPNERKGDGSEQPDLGGYHAWHSADMLTWTHHGPITDARSRWVTSAEYIDGDVYIYYDYPNDQDPHLMIDSNLYDGKLGKDMGRVFEDPTDGSDAGVMRDTDGMFHLIYEDYSAGVKSWDAPIAGYAKSLDGIRPFKVKGMAVDARTQATGEIVQYRHPHWMQHPDWDTPFGTYEKHEPEQDYFGDWTIINVGGQYYLFGDFDPVHAIEVNDGKRGSHMKIGRFTSTSINEPFEFQGAFGKGHPDPSVGFANGKFYLITQTEQDFVSSGPWVDGLVSRLGIDVNGDGNIDKWTDWQSVTEQYRLKSGYSRVVEKTAANFDTSELPKVRGLQVEFKLNSDSTTGVMPKLSAIQIDINTP